MRSAIRYTGCYAEQNRGAFDSLARAHFAIIIIIIAWPREIIDIPTNKILRASHLAARRKFLRRKLNSEVYARPANRDKFRSC